MAGLESLSSTQIKHLKRVFNAVDRDGDDSIMQADIVKTLQSLGSKDAATQAPTYLSKEVLGSDTSETSIDPTSFLTMMGQRLGSLSDSQGLLYAFESFDERDEGFVDVVTVREILAGDQEAVRGPTDPDR